MNQIFKRSYQNICSVILVFSSAACTVLAYQPASTGDVARIRVVTPEAVHTEVFVLPNAENGCTTAQSKQWQWLAILGQHLPHKGLQGVTIGMPGGEALKPISIAETTIPAGKPFPMVFSRAGYNYFCTVDLSFVPRVGVDYEARFSQTGRECHVGVAELKKSDDGSIARSAVAISHVKFCKS
ncbi:hypothetical protein [Paraburkholderia terrae]|uniref:hypothetical protein n=1 Tax=Paraburkholderia terrae TaxID=311230 RepID=UPI0012DFF597|nr:hypothetical protein [Paraburkholderia terrae]